MICSSAPRPGALPAGSGHGRPWNRFGCRELLGAVLARNPNRTGALDLEHDLTEEENHR